MLNICVLFRHVLSHTKTINSENNSVRTHYHGGWCTTWFNSGFPSVVGQEGTSGNPALPSQVDWSPPCPSKNVDFVISVRFCPFCLNCHHPQLDPIWETLNCRPNINQHLFFIIIILYFYYFYFSYTASLDNFANDNTLSSKINGQACKNF